MKILHICTSGEYTDGHTYQENLLTKYMAKLGHEVFLISSPKAYDGLGNSIELEVPVDYIDENGVHVYRLPFAKPNRIGRFFRKMDGFRELLYSLKPDVVFFHNPQSSDIICAAKYIKKYSNTTLLVDDHADYYNSAQNILSKYVKHKIIWRFFIRRAIKYTTWFYGTAPIRVEFLKDMYGIPGEKCKLLVMGVDDDMISTVESDKESNNIRLKHNIDKSTFLVLTGGKINQYRLETIDLMEQISESEENIKLIVFGKPDKDVEERFMKACENDHILFVGWLDEKQIYEYMTYVDLMVFPGKHSVLWEQAVGMGIPCIFRRIPGFEHVDLGGNALLLDCKDEREFYDTIIILYRDDEMYNSLKRVAVERGINEFSYYRIAKQCLDDIG